MCAKNWLKTNSFGSNNAHMGESSDTFIACLADELQRYLAKRSEYLPISLSWALSSNVSQVHLAHIQKFPPLLSPKNHTIYLSSQNQSE